MRRRAMLCGLAGLLTFAGEAEARAAARAARRRLRRLCESGEDRACRHERQTWHEPREIGEPMPTTWWWIRG